MADPQLGLDFAGVAENQRRVLAQLPDSIRSTFRYIEIVERELEVAGLDRKQNARVFRSAVPRQLLRGRGENLYRAHVRELIARARAGQSLQPGTDAECLAAMLETAMVAPLRPEALAVAERLFARVMPEHAGRVFGGAQPTAEKWAGQVDEDIAQLRKKLNDLLRLPEDKTNG